MQDVNDAMTAVTEIDVAGVGRMCRVTAPFDAALREMSARGASAPVPFATLAAARIVAGLGPPLSGPGGFVREAIVYTHGEPAMMVRESPFLSPEFASVAMARHRQDLEVYFGEHLPDELYKSYRTAVEEDAGKAPEARRVLRLKHTGICKIPLAQFPEDELLRWLFGGPEAAARYGAFLDQAGLAESPLWLVDWRTPEQEKLPYLRQFFFGGVGTGSSFNGGRLLGNDDGAMGAVWGIKAIDAMESSP